MVQRIHAAAEWFRGLPIVSKIIVRFFLLTPLLAIAACSVGLVAAAVSSEGGGSNQEAEVAEVAEVESEDVEETTQEPTRSESNAAAGEERTQEETTRRKPSASPERTHGESSRQKPSSPPRTPEERIERKLAEVFPDSDDPAYKEALKEKDFENADIRPDPDRAEVSFTADQSGCLNVYVNYRDTGPLLRSGPSTESEIGATMKRIYEAVYSDRQTRETVCNASATALSEYSDAYGNKSDAQIYSTTLSRDVADIMNSLRQQWCSWRDLENERVLRTKRKRRCLKVLIQRSTWQVSPSFLPVASCWSSRITPL